MRHTAAQYLAYVALVGVAWGCWLGEVVYLKGWPGLAWVRGFNWSSLPICVVLAVLSSYALGFTPGSAHRLRFISAASLIAFAAFLLARHSAFELFGGYGMGLALGPLTLLLLGWCLVPVGFPLLANRWLAPVHRWAIPLIAAALALSIPLAFATIRFFPAINGSTDQIHAFKMGYPVLWITALVPAAMRIARKHTSQQI